MGRRRPVRRRFRRRAPSRAERLIFLDASAALFVLFPLPLVITANAAVGKSWAGHATGILAGVTAGITFLFGALDLAAARTATTGSGGHNPLAIAMGFH